MNETLKPLQISAVARQNLERAIWTDEPIGEARLFWNLQRNKFKLINILNFCQRKLSLLIPIVKAIILIMSNRYMKQIHPMSSQEG